VVCLLLEKFRVGGLIFIVYKKLYDTFLFRLESQLTEEHSLFLRLLLHFAGKARQS